MWWLYFRRGGKLVGVAIIEAPTLYHARTRVSVRGIGKAVDYNDAKKLDDEDAALVPANCIGRLLLAGEAQQLSDRILRSQGRPRPAVARARGLITMWWLSFLDGRELVGCANLKSQTFRHAHASCGRGNSTATWRGKCRTH